MKSSISEAWLVAIASFPFALAHGQAAPWKIDMRQVRLPTGNGDCAPIELVVRDADGKTPMTPDGKQVDWQDFDITLTQGAGPLKLTGNGRFLCATAPGATGVVTAKYPEPTYLAGTGKGRTGKRLIPGVTASATLDVRSAGTAPQVAAAAVDPPPPATSPAPATSPMVAAPRTPIATELPSLPTTGGSGTASPEPPTTPTVDANVAPILTASPVSMTASATNVAATSTPSSPVTAAGTVVPELAPDPVIKTTIQPPRIELASFEATGLWGAPPRIEVANFVANGLWGPPPSIVLQGFTAAGEFPPAGQQ